MQLCMPIPNSEKVMEALARSIAAGAPLKGNVSRDRIVLRRASSTSRLPPEFVGSISFASGREQLRGEIRVPPHGLAASHTGIVLLAAIVGKAAAGATASMPWGVVAGVVVWGA